MSLKDLFKKPKPKEPKTKKPISFDNPQVKNKRKLETEYPEKDFPSGIGEC